MYLNLVLRKKQAIDKHAPNVSIEQIQKKKKKKWLKVPISYLSQLTQKIPYSGILIFWVKIDIALILISQT